MSFCRAVGPSEDQVLEGEHFLADVAAQLRDCVFPGRCRTDWLRFFSRELSRAAAVRTPPVWLKARAGWAPALRQRTWTMRSMTSTRGRPHHGEAFDDLVARGRGQQGEQGRTFFRGQIADDQGDGLRLFVLEQIEKLARVHFQERLHGGHRGVAPGRRGRMMSEAREGPTDRSRAVLA